MIGVLAGHPGPPDEWLKLRNQASIALEDALRRSEIPSTDGIHHRGKFKTLQCGVSHSSGQTKPGNLQNSRHHHQIVQQLNSLEPFKRFAGFAMCMYCIAPSYPLSDIVIAVMATWAPDLYAYYVEHLGALYAHYPDLQHIFISSIFFASTYNLSP